MSFKLINSNRFPLPGTNNRFLHLATVQDSIKEYICFVDTRTTQIYIEEITGGAGPFFIEDDSVVQDITNFLTEKGTLDISKPLIPDNIWYSKKK